MVEYFRHHDPDRTLIFTRTRRRAERLARTLNKAGITCEAIHGDRTQGQRQAALDGFKKGKIAVLVATDVVARGIDVDNITHVINFDIPTNPEDYVHRIGRTARAGASGIAVSLLTGEEVHELKAIERLIGSTLERHDLPNFDYDKRVIPESHQVQSRPGKLVWNGGAKRSASRGISAAAAASRFVSLTHERRERGRRADARRPLCYTADSAWATSSVGRAPARQAGGRWFNSNVAHHACTARQRRLHAGGPRRDEARVTSRRFSGA